MSKYSQDAVDAAASIAEAGANIPIRRFIKTYDAVTGAESGNTYSEISPPAVVLPVSPNDNFPEGLVLSRARKLLTGAVGLAFAPQPGDVAYFMDAAWVVKGNEPLAPDGTVAIIHTLYVERSGVSTADGSATAGTAPGGSSLDLTSGVTVA